MLTQNSFTYGVELEGAFTKTLISKMMEGKHTLNAKTDSSVRWHRIISTCKKTIPGFNIHSIVSGKQEIDIGVFNNQDELFNVLRLAKEGYFWDKSCGLHLHIKPKRNIDMLGSKIFDVDFLMRVQQFAYTGLCPHISVRRRNRYCRPYRNLENLIFREIRNDKYSFIYHNPDYKTFEMRFFAPCQHRVENIQKFMAYFIKELNTVTTLKSKTIIFKSLQAEDILQIAPVKINNEPGTLEIAQNLNQLERYSFLGDDTDEDEAHSYRGLDECDCNRCVSKFYETHNCCNGCIGCVGCDTCRDNENY